MLPSVSPIKITILGVLARKELSISLEKITGVSGWTDGIRNSAASQSLHELASLFPIVATA
jgi:hypothetical protein